MEEAYRINEQAGTVVAGSIAQWRSVFSDTPGQNTQPIIYECLDAVAIGNQQSLLSKAEKLFKRVEILVWFIESDEAKEGRLDEARYREYYRGRGPITEASEQWFEARVARGDYRLAAQAWCSRLDLAKKEAERLRRHWVLDIEIVEIPPEAR